MNIPEWYNDPPRSVTHIPELADVERHLLDLGFILESAHGPGFWGEQKGSIFYNALSNINRPGCYDCIRTWIRAYTNGKYSWDIQIPTQQRAINLYCRGMDGDAHRDDLCDDNLDGYRVALGKVLAEHKITRDKPDKAASKAKVEPQQQGAEQLSLF